MKLFTDTDLRVELVKRLDGKTQKELALQLGFAPQFINDVVHGRREISLDLAKALGYQRKVYFARVK